MKTLADAWSWYNSTRRNLERMNRLARKYWTALPWDGELGRDNIFRHLESEDIEGETRGSLGFIDDLAVVVLFSVFEHTIRHHFKCQLDDEIESITHPIFRLAAANSIISVEVGSFARLLEAYKDRIGPDVIEEVNQVRKYRNWVAHGRGGEEPPMVQPDKAYRRLQRVLDLLVPDEIESAERVQPDDLE
jgi:hypothetical protein